MSSAYATTVLRYGEMWEQIYNATPSECHDALSKIQRDNLPTPTKPVDVLAQTPAHKPVDVLAQTPADLPVVGKKADKQAVKAFRAAAQSVRTAAESVVTQEQAEAATTPAPKLWADEGEEDEASSLAANNAAAASWDRPSSSGYAAAAAHPPSVEAQAAAAQFVTPTQHKKKGKACKFKERCNNGQCSFVHPEGWDYTKNIQACPYKATCRSKFCFKTHPEGYNPLEYVQDCKFGAECKQHNAYNARANDKDCIFFHKDELIQ